MTTYHLQRDFAAPKSLVWRALTEADLVARWYGPGVETVIHEFDLREGGVWRTEMRMQSQSMFQRADFTAVDLGTRFECLQASTDDQWNIVDNPMMPDWPRLLRLEIALTAMDTGTRLDLTWEPYEATEAQIEAFHGAMSRMGGGWSMGMDVVEEMLKELG